MANEVRLIDANALHKILEEAQDGTRRICFSLVDYGDKDVCKGELGTYARAKRMVEEAPTIDPESLRPRGLWLENHHVSYDDMREEDVRWFSYTCAECNGEAMCDYDYCPNCGAKMEG